MIKKWKKDVKKWKKRVNRCRMNVVVVVFLIMFLALAEIHGCGDMARKIGNYLLLKMLKKQVIVKCG